jgi:carbon-monoxide dehydrogenase large subunit
MAEYQVIGQPYGRVDGVDKVTGAARYTADVQLPGTLWAKVVRSPFSHARILNIDPSEALALPGVRAVITGADTKGVLFGRRLRDIPALAEERVRFIGERVAAVAAEDEDIAEAAARRVEVEYEELQAVFDPVEAMRDDAPIIHPDVNSYDGLPRPLVKASNRFAYNAFNHGDMEAGWAAAEHIIEETYRLSRVHQGFLEPHCCLVWADPNGKVQIWAPNKAPHRLKADFALAVGIPAERVVVYHSYIGGDFGGKASAMDIPVCYFLSLKTGRPVRMVMDYAEEFTAGAPRHGGTIRIKTGVKGDGRFTAFEAEQVLNSGAYGGFPPGVNLTAIGEAADPYNIPNVHVEASRVYTNTIPSGQMRAPGEPQAVFAIESHVDVVARKLGLDPADLRRINIEAGENNGDAQPEHLRGRPLATLKAALDAAGYERSKPSGTGRGVAIAYRGPGGGESGARLRLEQNGETVIETPVFEQGTGTYTTIAQIIAEELAVPMTEVRVEPGDTDGTPYDNGVAGSRTTRVATGTTHAAVNAVREKLLQLAREVLGWPPNECSMSGGVLSGPRGERIRWHDLLEKAETDIIVEVNYRDTEPLDFTAFVVQVAEVNVDVETGSVKLVRLTTAHEVGTIINPIGHQGQINGGTIMGVGYGLMEELEVQDGRVGVTHFGDYKFPTAADIPELQTILVYSESGAGPYQAKGIGENPTIPVAAAIANAVADATGVRVTELPIKAQTVYRLLQEKQS